MVNTMKLEIVAPDGIVVSDDVEMVTLPGSEGQLGILPHHIPLVTQDSDYDELPTVEVIKI